MEVYLCHLAKMWTSIGTTYPSVIQGSDYFWSATAMCTRASPTPLTTPALRQLHLYLSDMEIPKLGNLWLIFPFTVFSIIAKRNRKMEEDQRTPLEPWLWSEWKSDFITTHLPKLQEERAVTGTTTVLSAWGVCGIANSAFILQAH